MMCNQRVRIKQLAVVLLTLAGMLDWLGRTSRQTLPNRTVVPAPTVPVQTEQKASRARAAESYSKLPLRFEATERQSGGQVDFLARGRGYTMFLKPAEAVVSLKQGTALRMQFLGANSGAKSIAMEELPGSVNYFIGNDPSKWRTNVRTYGRISYKDVYPGVDLFYYGNQQQLEYDLVVAQGADPRVARLGISGATKIQLGGDGDLVMDTARGTVRLRKPVAYQQTTGGQHAVDARYVLQGTDQVAFELGSYDRTKPLVIDPVLVYSSFLGGSGAEESSGIAVDAAGSAYVTGMTNSSNFPTVSAFQPSFAGGNYDVFVTKFTPDGSALVYSTYLGGSGQDLAGGIAVDSSGNAYVTGQTSSTDFPITAGAFQVSKQSGGADPAVFVTKLSPSGSALIYSTYLGGSVSDWGNGIAVDSLGRASVTGEADSLNFPVTAGAPQTQIANYDGHGFVTTLAANGASLVFSTYLGGTLFDFGAGVAVDSLNNLYVVGTTSSSNFPTVNALQPVYGGAQTAFIAKLNPDTSTLIYSTYLGGSGGDKGSAIAVDSSGSVYVTGSTSSSDFPTVNPFQATLLGPSGQSQGAFVSKLNPAGSTLVYSTYLGGGNSPNGDGDFGVGIAVDSTGAAYVTGTSASGHFPAVNSLYAFQGATAFVTKFTPNGSALVYSTFLPPGGPATAIAVDAFYNAYVMGTTNNSAFPTTPGSAQTVYGGASDAYVLKLSGDKTTTSAISSLNPSIFGEQVTFTASVTASIATAGTPTGTVSFADGATALGSAPLSNGAATFNTSSLIAGSHSINVQYGGDAYFSSSAATLGQTVSQAATTTTLVASPNPAPVRQPITFTATVAAVSPGAGNPTGTVTLTDGTTPIGTAMLSAGTAAFSIATLTLGSHTIVASYGGDPNFTASVSGGLSQAVAVLGAAIMVNESVTVADAPTLLGLAPFVAINVLEAVTASDAPTLLGLAPFVAINVLEGVTASDAPYAGLSRCDLQQTGSVSVTDVQTIVNEALGITPAVHDLSGDGKVTVMDVELEINGALGLGCVGYY